MSYIVKAAAAVLRLKSGGERYVYQGAQFDAAIVNPEHLKHLVGQDLVTEVAEAKPDPAPEVPEVKPKSSASRTRA